MYYKRRLYALAEGKGFNEKPPAKTVEEWVDKAVEEV